MMSLDNRGNPSWKRIENDTFAACCGARIRYSKPEKPANRIGIVVYESQVGTEFNTPHNSVKHINTKNGCVTVLIKKAWRR